MVRSQKSIEPSPPPATVWETSLSKFICAKKKTTDKKSPFLFVYVWDVRYYSPNQTRRD